VTTSGTSSGVVRVVTTLAPAGDELRGVAKSLVAKDADLWGAEASSEAAIRLGWLDLPESSEALLPQLKALHERFAAAGLDHVVLAGMGGSSLAPEVITRTAGVDLTVLDSTDPHQVGAALSDRLDRTVVVVASKSGGTVETDSHLRAYSHAFLDAGIDPTERIVIVTDPGSPLEARAREAGEEVVLADPNVGGRYSALSAFGLTPSLLAGADVERLLADARVLAGSLSDDEDNPGLELGAALGNGATQGRDKLVIADSGSGIVGFGDWAEQLVAESTGKQGKGILPVVVEGIDAPGFVEALPDTHRVVIGQAP
jgi:glucose-6-phosphate isomerase